MKSKRGFLLAEALLCTAMCSVLCLWSVAMIQIEMKKEELMNHLEEEMNRSWEEIFASLKECQACIVTEEEPLESEEEY